MNTIETDLESIGLNISPKAAIGRSVFANS